MSPRNVNIGITTSIVIFSFAYFIPHGHCCPAFSQAIGNMTPDYDLKVGDDLILNCRLYNNWVKTRDGRLPYVNSSMLVFKFDKTIVVENVNIINELEIQLKIPNASIENTGKYFCFLNTPGEEKKKLICNSMVSVGYAPFNAENFTCISINLTKLRCSWDVPKNTVETKYTLYDNLSSKTSCDYMLPSLSRPCPGPIEQGNENSCEWTLETAAVYQPLREKLCFQLVGNNSLGNSSQLFAVDHYSIVQPDKPPKLTIHNITTNSFMAVWLPPIKVSSKEEFPPGLIYEVKYKPRYSSTWQVRSLDNETHVTITNLIPYTDYDVQLRCRSRTAANDAKFWSDFVTTTFRTYPDIPYFAPEVAPGLFETRHMGNRRNITLYWKDVPQKFWNGEDFHYIISCFETYIGGKGKRSVNREQTVNSEKSSVNFVDLDIHSAYEFILTSANKEGKSHNFSQIKVQKKENMPQMPRDIKVVKLMHHKGHYNISWESPSHGGDLIESYTIFWCSRLRPSLFPCNGPFSWKFVPATVRAASLSLPIDGLDGRSIQFALSANSRYSSSGLEWAPCVIPTDGVLDKINNIVLQPLSSTSLNIIWYLDCSGFKHLVQEYKIYYCKVKNYNESCSGELKDITITNKYADNYTLHNLEPYSLYRVVALTVTKSGSSEESDPVFARTKAGAPSDPPQNFSILKKTDTTIEVTWLPPLQLNGAIDWYLVNIRKNGYNLQKPVKVYSTQQKLSTKFEQLTPYTNYTLELVACVNYDCSPPTLINTVTEIGVPGPMEVPIPEVHNETFVQVSWIPPSEPNGPIDFYVLHLQWESGDESYTESINVSGVSYYDVVVTCPVDDTVMLYFFSIQAVNIKGKEVLYGNRSNAVQSRLCFSSNGMEFGIIIGIIVGAAAALAFLIISLYFLIRWMKKKVDTIKDIKVQLPHGLETPQGNPLNSYENFKNGLVRKPSDSNLSPKTFYGRLNSYASDESDPKDRNDSGMAPFGNNSREALIHNIKDQSDGNKSNNGGTNIGKGHDSISSSLTTRTQLSSDSGAETDVQAPPSPESDNLPLGLPHTSPPQPNKSSLSKVNEAHSCDSKDSGLEKEEGGSEKESDAPDPNHYAKFVRYLDNPNHPYNRRQVSEKGTLTQQLPYSKFGVNMPGISGYVPLSSTLAHMSRSLANSEPSVVDAESVNKSNPALDVSVTEAAPPYSKYGIGRSLGQSLNMPVLNESDNLGTGYSKCGIGPAISWLQQPRSPYIAANLAPVLLGSDTSRENKQLNPMPNNGDFTGHLNKAISPLPLAPSCSSPSRNKGYVTVDSMNKPSSFLPNQQINGPAYSCLEENKMPHSKGYVSVQDAKNMLSDDRKLPHPSDTKDQTTGIPGYSKFDIQCDRLQNTPDIQTLDPVLTGTKPKTYPSGVHQGYVPYQNPAFDVSSVGMPFNSNDHPINGNLNGDLSPISADMNFGCGNEYEFDTDNHSPSKYLPQSKTCKPASELSNGYVTVNADSSIDAIRIVPTDSHLCPSLTDTAV